MLHDAVSLEQLDAMFSYNFKSLGFLLELYKAKVGLGGGRVF